VRACVRACMRASARACRIETRRFSRELTISVARGSITFYRPISYMYIAFIDCVRLSNYIYSGVVCEGRDPMLLTCRVLLASIAPEKAVRK
jgi:hypothetical protein